MQSDEYPLLIEDERYGPYHHRRKYPMHVRSRARNQIKGAAAIFRRWPEHWTTLLAYWWVGLAMIAVTTFIIYNSLISYVTLYPTQPKLTKPTNSIIKHFTNPLTPSSVFMHIFVNENEDIQLHKYLPYIEVISNEYKHFNYNFIIITNDTTDTTKFSDEENNDVALKSVIYDRFNYKNIMTSNIAIKHTTLSTYLNNSPLKKYWKTLPVQFIEFLVRALSVWETGGIALNPIILTPQSTNSIYMDKVHKIFQNFRKLNSNPNVFVKNTPKSIEKAVKPKLNNIRDIINALENEDVSHNNSYQDILAVAESRNDRLKSDTKRVADFDEHQIIDMEIQNNVHGNKIEGKQSTNPNKEIENNNKSSDFFPPIYESLTQFLESLSQFFHKHNHDTKSETNYSSKTRRHAINDETTRMLKEQENKAIIMRNIETDMMKNDVKPMIVSAKGIIDNKISEKDVTPVSNELVEKLFELTVDLKGNIIATETSCHSFIGGLFTNAIHHDESETLTDFIIKELSIFCKGLLASCVGIDVILV